MLDEVNVSQVDFEAEWSAKVAAQFNLPVADVQAIYTSSDPYDTNMNTRAMWKANCTKSVQGTPTVFMNGVMLDYCPATVQAWLDLLQKTYDSQYGATGSRNYVPLSFLK